MFIGKWDVERKEDFLYEGSCRIHKVDGISVWFFGVLYNKKTLGYDPAANEAKIIIEIYREKGYTGPVRRLIYLLVENSGFGGDIQGPSWYILSGLLYESIFFLLAYAFKRYGRIYGSP